MSEVMGKSTVKSTELRIKGNDLFRKKNPSSYRMVLSLYSKSIAYAPSNSEQLAMAFSNRSALWLYLRKYDLCLVDIDRALNITKSNDLKQKLSSRKIKCQDHVSSPAKEARKELEPPKFVPSLSIPCGADNIMMNFDSKYGRHYVAKRDIRPGETVMIEESPFATAGLEQMYIVCSHCLAFAWAGIPCESCIFAIYCSESCKKEAWSQYHHILCVLLSIDWFHNRILSFEHEREMRNRCGLDNALVDASIIVLRTIIIVIEREGLDTVLETAKNMDEKSERKSLKPQFNSVMKDGAIFELLYSLTTSKLDVDKYVVNVAENLMYQLREFLHVPPSNYNDNEALSLLRVILEKLFKICQVNTFKFLAHDCSCKDPEYKKCYSNRGSVLAPLSAFFNHSCDYNVDRIFVPGPKIVYFANQPIAQGKQLFIDYGISGKKALRLSLQRRLYSFSCQCMACVEDWPPLYARKVSDAGFDKIFPMHYRTVQDDGYKFMEAPIDINQKVFHGCIRMLEFIFKNFSRQEATVHADYYQRYIIRYFYHCYGEDVDLIHLDDYFDYWQDILYAKMM